MPADLTQDILNSDAITLLTRGLPNPELISDTAANDSDKTLTVDSNEVWEILSLYMTFAATATSGTRVPLLLVRDGSGVNIAQVYTGLDITASQTRYFLYAPGFPMNSSWVATNRAYLSLPPLILPASFDIRVYDAAAVDAEADDMALYLLINRYDV